MRFVHPFAARVSRLGLSLAAALLAGTSLLPVAHTQTATLPTVWQQQSLAVSPSARSNATMAYEEGNMNVVLFGGMDSNNNYLADTWTYNNGSWLESSTSYNPPARQFASMAYDPANRNMVLFGGYNGAALSDTWGGDGSGWGNQNATGPSARYGASMAYHPNSVAVVLFGGLNDATGTNNETWEWNGYDWNQQFPANSPPARAFSSMAYDAATGNLVLFGGIDSGNPMNDTWVWDGNNWTQQLLAGVPSARYGSVMSYNSVTGNIMLFGGHTGRRDANDTWVYNGTGWAQQAQATNPSGRTNSTMAYDAETGTLVLVGGTNIAGTTLADTWAYGVFPTVAATTSIGTASSQTPVNFLINTAGTLPALSNNNVVTQGAAGLDFTLGDGSTCTGAVTAGQTCTVNVAFNPQAPGQRLGAVNLVDANNNVLATGLVTGTGTGPLALFQPGVAAATYSTSLNTPRSLAVDASGNVYLANTGDQTILKFPAGSTSPVTLATADTNTTAVAVDGAGNVYYTTTDTNTANVYELVGGSPNSTPVAIATLPNGDTPDDNLAVDAAGDLYLSGSGTHSIYEIAAGTHMVSTLSYGTGGRIVGMTVDPSGNVFALDFDSAALLELPAGASTAQMLYSGAPLDNPHDIAMDAAGNLYTANINGTYAYRFAAGNYGATPVTLAVNAARSIAVGPTGTIYTVTDDQTLLSFTRASVPSLSFANTATGSSSASQTVTLENDGNAPLTFPTPSTGQNPSLSSNFALDNSSTCPLVYSGSAAGSLAAGATCIESLNYSPVTAGAVSGSLMFTDNSLNGSGVAQSVSMTGATASNLNLTVVGQNVPYGTSSIILEFIVGYGGNLQPSSTPSLTVNGDPSGVGAISCITKVGHMNCTATYDTSSLMPGMYTIAATQPADGNYTTDTSSTATLTITGVGTHVTSPVKGVLQTGIVATRSKAVVPQPLTVHPTATVATPLWSVTPTYIAPMLLTTQPSTADDNSDSKSDDSTKKQPK